MKTKFLLTVILIIAALLSGCSHYYYVANNQNVPLFREKNETNLSGFYGFDDYSQCIEIQAAHSLTNHIGITGSYMHASAGDRTEDNFGKGSMIDAAIGYYKPVKKYFVFEMYGGAGIISQYHEYENDISQADLSSFKLFIQPAYGFTTKYFDMAVSARVNHLSFGEEKVYGKLPEYDQEYLNDISGKSFFIFEPAATLRVGFGNLKLQLQGQYVWVPNTHRNFHQDYHLSAGAVITLGERFNKQETNPGY